MFIYIKIIDYQLEAADVHMQLEPMNDGKNMTGETKDPCGGTDGTGQITSVGQNKITIQRKDGVQEEIKITAITKIVNSAGNILASDLKIGYRVTVVVGLVEEDSRIASAILVCNLSK